MDIFDQPSAEPVRPMPDRPCTEAQHAKELLGLPADWRVVSWRTVGDPQKPLGIELRGGVYRQVITRGPRKGRPDYRKPEAGTEATVTIGRPQHNVWAARWEVETGWCRHCSGTGIVFAGWDHEKGTRMRPCDPCGGTGDRPAAAEAA